MIARHAELARSLGEELGLADEVLDALAGSYERWDGRAYPGGARRGRDPGGVPHRPARRVPRGRPPHRRDRRRPRPRQARRSGKQFDPTLVDVVCTDVEKVFHELDELGSWDAVIDGEPALARTLVPGGVRRRAGRHRPLRRPQVAVHARPLPGRRRPGRGRQPPTSACRRGAASSCTGPAWSRASAGSACPTRSGTSPARSPRRVGAGAAPPAPTPSGCCTAPTRSPRSGRLAVQLRERLDGSGYPRGLTGPAISRRRPGPGRRRRVPGDAGAPAAPARASRSPTHAAPAARRRTRRPAGRRRGRRRPARRRPARRPAPRRSRPGSPPGRWRCCGSWPGGCSNKEIAARLVDQPQDRGQPHRARLHEDRRHNRAEAGLFAMRHGLLPAELG